MTALIAKRNTKFHSAVSDLIVACSSHNPPLDPVELLLEATAEHLPVHPDDLLNEDDVREKGVREKQEELGFYERNPDHRKSIETIIEEITSEENGWYEGQIVEDGHRTFEAREAIYGKALFEATELAHLTLTILHELVMQEDSITLSLKRLLQLYTIRRTLMRLDSTLTKLKRSMLSTKARTLLSVPRLRRENLSCINYPSYKPSRKIRKRLRCTSSRRKLWLRIRRGPWENWSLGSKG